jgi:hypothetical protein
MKKFFTAIVALMLAVPSFAQFASGGFELDKSNLYYGVRFGLAFGNISGDSEVQDGNETADYSGLKTGFTIGGVLGLRLSQTAPVFLESGLYYTQRGGKDGKYTADLNCLEIPLLIKYGFQAGSHVAVLPFIGPYFAYGVAGDREYIDETSGEKQKEGVYKKFLNRNDMGFKLGCGLEYNLLYAEIGYQFGIANIADNDNNTTHANALYINLGVNF